MTTEIERKFLPLAAPAAELLGEGELLRQGYLAQEDTTSVRVRFAGRSALLAVKVGAGVSRTEVEVAITEDEAAALWRHTVGRRIEKTRHRVPLDDGSGLVAEVDVYGGELVGLCTVEVEFTTAADAASFVPPLWFGRDVTDQPGWTNAELARRGRPD